MALRRALVRLLRIGTVTIIAGFALFALTLLAVRFVVFPRVDAYRDTVTAALSRQLGHPVEIAMLSTGWDGWNPKIVIAGLRIRDNARDVSLLELPEVDLVVAWTSLPLFELRLKQLTIERPRLAVRRDRSGLLHIAGIEFDPASASEDPRITDWILRQRRIVVRDALVTWNDDLRNAPQLVLDRVQLRLESRFGYHHFGLKGVPPTELAAPLDVRGEFRGSLPKDWQSATGQLYVRLDYADVDAWREWLPLPPAIASGEGALRAWFTFAQGEVHEIVADVELADVKAKLDDKLPELALAHLSGRAGWRSAPPQHEFFTRDLSFVTRGGQRLDPTTFTASMSDATVETGASGRVEFDRLQLEPLRDVAAHLPLPEKLRADLARFAPRGTLTSGKLRWEGLPDAPTALAASAGFDRLGVVAQDALPGASGLSGRFESTLEGGTVKLAAHAGAVELPRLFADAIPFDALQGDVHWERKGGRTRLDVRGLEFANAYAAGSVSATYRTVPGGPGEIDLTGHVVRGDPAEVHRLLPLSLAPALRDWVRASLVKGAVTDARIKLLGNLAAFPFTDPKSGQFVVTVKGRGMTFAYAPGWPAIEDGEGEIRFEAAAMTVDAAKGHTFGLALGRTRATIPDLRNPNPQLTLDGTATGPLADFLRFVEASPVAGMIDHMTDGATGAGNGRLALKLMLPVKKPETAKVNGEFLFANGDLQLPDLPPLAQVNGEFQFSEREVRAHDVAFDVMGGPAKMSAASADGRVRVTASGTANLAQLRRQNASGYLSRVSGMADWTATANVRPGATSWVLESPLKGAAVDLPAPLGKAAGDVLPLRVERRADSASDGEDRIDVSYGRAMQVALHRKLAKDGATVDRALVSLGRAATRPDATRAERSGLWVRAELPALNVDDWLALREREKGSAGASDPLPPLAGIDLDVGDLDLFGRRWIELKATALQSERDWKLDLRGRDVAGTAVWSTPDASMPNGRVVARLARFAMPAASEGAASSGDKAGDARPGGGANPWPELDIAADAFASKGRDLGKLELIAKPQGTDWRIEKLVLASDSGRIEADGAWRTQGREQTRLDVALEASDAGAFLARFGYPDALQGASTHIDGQLAWSGAPSEFDYPTLNGKLHVAVGPGRFVKIEPGFGKLLGVLSLQSLPRRISLDFRDIFSEGFAFDDINGNVRVVNGVMSTDNLLLMGPAAKVNIAGDADLAKETQRLTVRVQPALSGGVSAGAALLFLANPIVGAAVGAGSLLAQKVMRDPIEQMFSYQYAVTGSWSDPVVTRSGTAMASVAPGVPGAPATTPESSNK